MRITIVTDAWRPQVNGVVRTIATVVEELEARGHQVTLIAPDQYRSMACPTYPEIRLALATRRGVGAKISAAASDAIHIATEGPLGLAARRWCLARKLPFTTAYHTQFPDYIAERTGLPPRFFWRYIRWFHAPSMAIMAATDTVARQLAEHGLPHSVRWGRGVDLKLFTPGRPPHPKLEGLARPILLYVGRIAVEKNIEAFLACKHRGTKVIVGDGPARAELEARHPEATWLGTLAGEALASVYSGADVFVFPSRTDTFGLVMIEALASGTPVAAFPVQGPLDVLAPGVGAMSENLDEAVADALRLDRGACAAYAQNFTWSASADQFLAGLAPVQNLEAA